VPNICLYIDKNRISPYAMSVYVALQEKGLSFEERVIDLDQQQQKSADYLAICPSAKVPCLVVDDFSLFESWAITEYLEDAFPAPEYPALYSPEIQARAKCRAIQALIKTDFMLIRQQMPSNTIFQPSQSIPLLETPVIEEIQRLISLTKRMLGDQWLTEHWSIADFDLAFMLHRLLSHQIELPEKILSYIERNFQRTSVQGWIDAHEKLQH
jgi:glutathione S-transferase